MSKDPTSIERRGLLKAVAGAGALSLVANAAPSSRVAQENQKPGTTEWQLRHYRFDSGSGSGLRSPMLEGYVSDVSAYPGDKLDIMVSTSPAARFIIDFYRLGYYGGKGGRHMLKMGPVSGTEQPVPLMGMERVRECAWKPSAQLAIPDDWPSGVYLGKLSLRDQPVESYVIFIVKDKRPADVLFQCSDFTWQAYNKWPGWDSLYDTGVSNRSNGFSYTGPHVRVSFDRPYGLYGQVHRVALSLGSGEFLLWEFPMAFWLEQHGYDVAYCSNADVERDPALLRRCKVFLSVGHDEYWTRGMYENTMAARDRGVSLGFFSGNAVCRIIEPYNSTVTGKPLRAFARLKHFDDEEKLMGVKSYGPGYGDYVVRRADHWMFEGTGMQNGDSIQGLIGWEFHGTPAQIPGLVEVASAQLAPYSRRPEYDNGGKHSSVIYPGPKNNWIFNAGTIWWPEGLSSPPGHAPAASEIARTSGPDERVQKMTRNLLDRSLRDSSVKL
jgi:N,N-dimethylformamidase beta subunit-like, C-terminal